MNLPRRNADDVPHTFALEGNHAAYRNLLPHMTPLYIYTGQDDEERVRWSIRREYADQTGLATVAV